MSQQIRDLEHQLYNLLVPEVRSVLEAVTSKEASHQQVHLPDPDEVDAPIEELASLVARTSNAYGRMARFAGMAKAEYKLAKGRYDRKYKRSRVGRNDAERDKAAMDQCEDEHVAMTVAEAISDMADSLEHASRVASESARKMYDKATSMSFAQKREDHGIYRDSDFRR